MVKNHCPKGQPDKAIKAYVILDDQSNRSLARSSFFELIPEVDPTAEILLLLGRDIIRVHKVREQVNGPHNAPFAQCLDLG